MPLRKCNLCLPHLSSSFFPLPPRPAFPIISVSVKLFNGLHGTVRFIGETAFADGEWIGVEVKNGQGKSNGTVNGIRYFTCKSARANCALFVRRHQISKVMQGYGSKMQRRAHVRQEHRRHRRAQAEAGKRNRDWQQQRQVESQTSMRSVPTRDAGRAEPMERVSPTRAGTGPREEER